MQQRDKGMADQRLRERLSSQEFDSLNLWCRVAKTTIKLDIWLDGGKTKAKVAVVYLRDNLGLRKLVLKYCPLGKRQALDKEAFDMAAGSGPLGFAKKHLIALDRATERLPMNGSEGSFILMKWPPGSKNYVAMSALRDNDAISTACEAVTKSILVKWNESGDVSDNDIEGLAPTDFIREIVGDKCAEGGPIHDVARTLGLLSAPAFDAQNGQKLPNPFKAATVGSGLAGVAVHGIRGNAHGDLHPENILVRRPAAQKRPPARFFEDYILIDLSTFSSNRLLAVDPVHLTMSAIALWLKDLSPDVKNRTARYLLNPEEADSSGIPSQLAATVKLIHKSGLKYAKSGSLQPDWQTERLLAIIGCALLFAARDFNGQDPAWFMQVAGMAIEALTGPVQNDGHHVEKDPGPVPASPAANPARETHPADDSVVVPFPLERSARAPSGIERDVDRCLDLAAELAAAVAQLDDNLSAHDMRTAITAIPSIAADLDEALAAIVAQRDGRAGPTVFDGTAARIARNKLQEARQQLDRLRKRGTNPSSIGHLTDIMAELHYEILRILPDRHDGPHA